MTGAADNHSDFGVRLKDVTIVKPIVYGNISSFFGAKREEDGHTHQWTVYVKPYHNEDMSTFIREIHFKLHKSYSERNRIVVKPPYEVTETGWGEFEILIKICFRDPKERPVILYHLLKLQDPEERVMNGQEKLASEFYEEIIFQNPTVLMRQLLTTTCTLSHGIWQHETDFEEQKEKTLQIILDAKDQVRSEIMDLMERLNLAKETIEKFEVEINK